MGMAVNFVTFYESLPADIIEDAAETLAAELLAQDFRNVTLIGHSAGGLVARCTLEAFQIRHVVRSVVTLATPHLAWHMQSSPEHWNERPLKNFPYLLLVGDEDLTLTLDWTLQGMAFDLSHRDEKLKTLKIILPGADHSSIHEEAADNQVAKFIVEFNRKRSRRYRPSTQMSWLEIEDPDE